MAVNQHLEGERAQYVPQGRLLLQGALALASFHPHPTPDPEAKWQREQRERLSGRGGLRGRGAPLTQHQDVFAEHQRLLVLGDGTCPGATVLQPHLGQ